MIESTNSVEQYSVCIAPSGDGANDMVFTFVPKLNGQANAAERSPRYVVKVSPQSDGLSFHWSATDDDPGPARTVLQAQVEERVKNRREWIERVSQLIESVDRWAREIGWSTRRIEKTLDDIHVGKHVVPALLLQDEACRAILEPVGRSAPGTEGVVDLYLMPAYDDIATLYFYNGQWHLHYVFPGSNSAATLRTAGAVPVGKETIEQVLTALRRHAA